MPTQDSPLKPIEDNVVAIERKLTDFMRLLLSKVKPMAARFTALLVKVKKSAKSLAAKVGKGTIDKILKLGDKLLRLLPMLEKMVMNAVKFARRIIATIRKAPVVEKVFKAVKAMVARLASMYRTILARVAQMMILINPIQAVLKIVTTFSTVLSFLFSWISEVGSVEALMKRASSVVKKAHKMLKAEAKRVTQMVKEANQLKPA
ncbi:MAG: hypothetical protein AAGF60_06760 [Pseudomonadota bacterium]